MYTKSIFLFFTLLSSTYATPLEYLNTLRTAAGLVAFTPASQLSTAAQNHSDYMQLNNTVGHGEVNGNSGYTGSTPSERTQYAGYSTLFIGENVSYGTPTAEASIDGLFSAIYHRFGFLHLSFDTVGIGQNTLFYTYDLSNSQHEQLCQGASYSGTGSYYLNVCADSNKHISVSAYSNASNAFASAAPALILWPFENAADIPPVFYEESPDPLPDDSVSGYPLSVEFNHQKFDSAPNVTSFTIEDASGTSLNTLTRMTQANDPASRFTSYQTALFPEKRLEWGSRYNAFLSYESNGTSYTKSWCFSTQSLSTYAPHVYRIENTNDITLNVIAGESYALYIVPNHTNDTLQSVNYTYTANSVDFSFIDQNTAQITLDGSIGTYASFTFTNGQKITLNIQNSDTATVPKNETCPALNTPMYTLSLLNNTTTVTDTVTPVHIILTVNKPNTTTNIESPILSVTKNKTLSLDFDTTLQTLEGFTLSNNQWTLSETLTQYLFTYTGNNGDFPNNTPLHLGLTYLLTPPLNAKGFFTFTGRILNTLGNTNIQDSDAKSIILYSNLPN